MKIDEYRESIKEWGKHYTVQGMMGGKLVTLEMVPSHKMGEPIWDHGRWIVRVKIVCGVCIDNPDAGVLIANVENISVYKRQESPKSS